MSKEIRRGGHHRFTNPFKPLIPKSVWNVAKQTKDFLTSQDRYPSQETIIINGQEFKFRLHSPEDRYLFGDVLGEHQYLGEFIDSLQPGDVVYNISAGIGTHCIPADILGPGTTVFAFEPNPRTRKVLIENVLLNKANKTLVYDNAFWSRNSDNLFLEDSRMHSPSVSESMLSEASLGGIDGKRIDTFVSVGNKKPDVALIDVEGSELEVLSGLGDISPRELFIEIHHDRGVTRKQVEQVLQRNYELAGLEEREDQLLAHYSLS